MNGVTNDSLVESKISLKKAVYLSFIVVVAGCFFFFFFFFFWGGGGTERSLLFTKNYGHLSCKVILRPFPPAISHGSFTVHLKN